MGKTRSNRFKRPQFTPDGLSVSAVKEVEAGEEQEELDSPALEFLEKLQSSCADVREFACASLSRVVQQTQCIPSFLQKDAVRRLGPLLLDHSLVVRETATGALRNLSVCGGPEVCEDMVRQDILTPLTALLKECCVGFNASPATVKDPKHTVDDVANEAVNLLWNLCESSCTALSVFNRAGLLDTLLLCLERHPQNIQLAISAAHCLHTVTEDNQDLAGSVNGAVLAVLENALLSKHASMEYVLLRTLAAGSVWNLRSCLSSTRQAEALTTVVSGLAHCLSLDAGQLIQDLFHAQGACLANGNTLAHVVVEKEQHEGEEEMMEEEEEGDGVLKMENGGKRMKKDGKKDKDMSDFLPRDMLELREATALLTAQQTSLEIIVNMCCSDEPSDDEWEEMSSSDESEMCSDACAAKGNASLFSPLCLSAELHTTLLNHNVPQQVLKKAEFPSPVALELCRKDPAWRCLIKKMQRVQCRALTCLHNILAAMDTECLGGAAGLQAVAQHLSTLVFSSADVLKDEEFLESVTSAMRSLLQIMASKDIPQCMSPQQLMSMCEAATQCDLVSVRVNALAILGITGSTLAKEKGSGETLQMIGHALLTVASKDPNLVVCGEALDALFDVFADGEEAERAAQRINLHAALKALQPAFKAKIRKEGRGKYSPDQLCVLDNVKTNLRRFIGYLETLKKK